MFSLKVNKMYILLSCKCRGKVGIKPPLFKLSPLICSFVLQNTSNCFQIVLIDFMDDMSHNFNKYLLLCQNKTKKSNWGLMIQNGALGPNMKGIKVPLEINRMQLK